MRVSTLFNRVLSLEGTQVVSVDVSGPEIVAVVRAQARLHRCPCGWATTARYDVSQRRWRHLDAAGKVVWLQAEIARIDCHACERVRTEDVPWARPAARCSRDFEDHLVWLAQRMDKTSIATLMRCAWRTVDNAVKRVVAEHLNTTDADCGGSDRLEGLVRIGVDEISYKRGHKYLTVVADHDTGRVVWVGEGRSNTVFEEFFTALGSERCAKITAISMDMSPTYRGVARAQLPNAQICFDPFHVIKYANEALDSVFAQIREGLYDRTQMIDGRASRLDWRRARFVLRRGAETLTGEHREILDRLREEDLTLARAWELKEGLRELYKNIKAPHIRSFLLTWCHEALKSKIPAFVAVAKRVRNHLDGIANAVALGLSNSRLEGLNSKIRVIQRRGYGHRYPDTLIAMIHLCLGGITRKLPHER